MGLFDELRTSRRVRHENAELHDLYNRLSRHAILAEDTCQQLCWRVVLDKNLHAPRDLPKPLEEAAWRLCWELLVYEGYFPPVEIDWKREELSLGRIFDLAKRIRHQLAFFEQSEQQRRIEEILTQLLDKLLDTRLIALAHHAATEPGTLFVPLVSLHADPAGGIDDIIRATFQLREQDSPVVRLGNTLINNMLRASGIDPNRYVQGSKEPIWPSQLKGTTPEELVRTYLAGTPFIHFFYTHLPFSIPPQTRFEHTHIVGGSGHGKTQLLQSLILDDLPKVNAGEASIIVIESQGGLIKNILELEAVGLMADRVVLIYPRDVKYPPALNLFDFGLDRIGNYNEVEQERLINGAIALYEYVFGALLGAELTQRQGVIFRYLARLLLVIPGATIHDLMDFMQEPEAVRPYLGRLDDPMTKRFFETQFFAKTFDDTRQQILTRLWGVLSNRVLARMFSQKRNKINLFEAMNRGSLILIHTDKDLLKQEGCEILGRFFIALLSQAAQERASVLRDALTPAFVYIDEAHEYFDSSMENLVNQARKFQVGLALAHQNLDQFEQKLRATVTASTSIKLAGGLSAKDARAFAKEMGCTPEFIQSMRKHEENPDHPYSDFACMIRNYTPRPVSLSVPLLQMERAPKVHSALLEDLIQRNRAQYCADTKENGESPPPAGGTSPDDDSPLGDPELL